MQTAQLMTLFQNMMAQQKTNFVKPSNGSKEDSFNDLIQQKKDQISDAGKPEKPTNDLQKPQDTDDKPQAPAQEEDTAVSERDLLAASVAAQLVQIVPAQVQSPVTQQVEQPVLATPAVETSAAPIVTQAPVQQQSPLANASEAPLAQQQAAPTVQQPVQAEAKAETKTAQASPLSQNVQTVAQEQPVVERSAQTQEAPLQNAQSKDEIVSQAAAPQAEQPVFQIKDAVPVKVGEAQPTVDAEAPDMEAKLATHIEKGLQSVGDKIEIRLTPENLGTITVEMTAKGGQIGLVIHTENAKTASLLSQHAGSLGALVENRTGETVNIQVQQQQPQQHSYDGHNRQQQEQHAHQQHQQHSRQQEDDFAQQLRLGLFSVQTAS